MALSVNLARPAVAPRRSAAATSTRAMLAVFALLFAMFCAWDYSSYGGGYVATVLGEMQRSFQSFVFGFKIRM